jgi:hypothetical protein
MIGNSEAQRKTPPSQKYRTIKLPGCSNAAMDLGCGWPFEDSQLTKVRVWDVVGSQSPIGSCGICKPRTAYQETAQAISLRSMSVLQAWQEDEDN